MALSASLVASARLPFLSPDEPFLHTEDPVERRGELIFATVGIEQAEDIQGDDQDRACSLSIVMLR
jgi:hypothetical protein